MNAKKMRFPEKAGLFLAAIGVLVAIVAFFNDVFSKPSFQEPQETINQSTQGEKSHNFSHIKGGITINEKVK